MGSVSGPVAEIIRSDSRIIKEHISTRRLPRIISGLRSLPPEDSGFLVPGIPETVGDEREYIDNSVLRTPVFRARLRAFVN